MKGEVYEVGVDVGGAGVEVGGIWYTRRFEGESVKTSTRHEPRTKQTSTFQQKHMKTTNIQQKLENIPKSIDDEHTREKIKVDVCGRGAW